ncbi:MAG TPA: tyrosine--tRNA ligase [Motilibacterales bacterium]|nr:tyrosine--tRNA ligase [Motilibacterales bacterium]
MTTDPAAPAPAPLDQAHFGGASVLDDLAWRGLIAHSTDLEALRTELAAGPMTFYCGFDPTAASLHVGHLAQTLTARRLQLAGHPPLALVGGATGMIGDPKLNGERTLDQAEVVSAWSEGIRRQLERYFDFEGPAAARMVNNHDWTAPMSVIEFLRDIGKHFSVNRMLDREAVARRLADQGISYTEFSYVLLQSMDYLELFRRHGCRLQTGGSDQFGNIVAGVDLVRRVEGISVHALTTPLMTKADGTKFGKTEGGAVWLDPELTSPYAFYQFWLNSDDRDVPGNLRMFSFRGRAEIEALDVEMAERPAARAGQRALAQELTEMVHGADALAAVEAASRALFGSGELREVPEATLDAALRETEFGEVRLPQGSAVGAIDLLVASGLAPSKGAARRTIADGGASVNNVRIADDTTTFTAEDTLAGGWLVVRRGRRAVSGVRLVTG